MNDVAQRWSALQERVTRACAVVGRSPTEVAILAAVKTQPPERIVAVLEAGAHLLGHNRAQEMAELEPRLHESWPGTWETHFIGALQTNKVNQVLRYASCIQSVDRSALAERLSAAAGRLGRTVEVFVEVNASGEETKSGVQPEQALEFAVAVAGMEGLRLRGLMTIGKNSPDAGEVRAGFEEMARLSAALVSSGMPGTADAGELSMGMSTDLDIAVAAGSTMVRVGTALFGPRTR
ncbi:MAG: YggS family pyridoxal phosphate-dependent enzyme [Actinobacteria bacterium]|nr:YggS family pyridoxal phosphate-dependent enzyme [Actinomycetota bacterium]